MSLSLAALSAILLMAMATYLTRIGGVLLVQHMPMQGRLAIALEAMPGAILIAVIAPIALATGWPETVAAAIVLIAAVRLPTAVVVVIGMASAGLLRNLAAL
ncbi:MAG: AzlD domain-containing protein [Pseudomonadota bacterium]